MSYRFKNGHVPGFASSYVVRREDGDRFFFATREDAAQALDMADRAAHPLRAPSEPTEKGND